MKTRNLHYIFLILCSFGIGITGCSDWETVVNIPDNGPVNSKRVVVIEEFTGASCVNCPKGIAANDAIRSIYPYNVIVVEIHSNFLGQPATAGQVNLRTPDAQAIEAFLGNWLAKPEAAFNRLYDDVGLTYRYGTPESWKSYVDAELNKPPKVELKATTTFDDVSRELKINLTLTGLEAINEPVHLHCGISESNIIADQLDNTGKLLNFVHNHVLRKMITPIPGEKVTDVLSSGQTISKEYSFTLPQDSILWKPENCKVFAYASMDQNKKYILQGTEAKVK
jgi:hypothetical protein